MAQAQARESGCRPGLWELPARQAPAMGAPAKGATVGGAGAGGDGEAGAAREPKRELPAVLAGQEFQLLVRVLRIRQHQRPFLPASRGHGGEARTTKTRSI